MTESQLTLTECKSILNKSSDAIVVLDHQDKPIYQNPAFAALPGRISQAVLKDHRHAEQVIERIPIDCGTALIVQSPSSPNKCEKVLVDIIEQLQHTDNLFEAAAMAVYKALKWRWVSVTRFNGGVVEVLAHCFDGEITQNFSFELAGSPCEEMIRTRRFTLFTDVSKALPDNEALRVNNIKTYAGIVYRDNDNQPVGHIMVLHDEREVDYRHVEEVLKLATLALSSHLMLEKTNQRLQDALEESRTDSLTGLANRKLFDEHMASALQQFRNEHNPHVLAIIDVDKFKFYNDTYGHVEGDQLLRLLATELTKIGRSTDLAYRIGGDEFAMIFQHAGNHVLVQVERQFQESVERLSLLTRHRIGGSIGFATLEDGDDVDSWYRRADSDMYRNKQDGR
ncbi:MAG: GGDEF domain-containing protein [Oceanobacter sp.]